MNILKWHLVQGLLVGGIAGYALGFGGPNTPGVLGFALGGFWGLLIGLLIDIVYKVAEWVIRR